MFPINDKLSICVLIQFFSEHNEHAWKESSVLYVQEQGKE